jgi:hypothetical protein
METSNLISKPVWWTGTILKILLSLFLLVDAVMKLIKHPQYVEGTKQLGLPESCVQFLGLYLLIATLLYVFPRTVVLGLLFLMTYLGAAVAITYQVNNSGHPYVFPVMMALLLVVAEFLRNQKVRTILPLVK